MKILLVNPLSRLDDAPRHIPFGVAILANIAHMMGHQVGILDLNAFRLLNTPEALRKEFTDPDWKDVDFIGITGLHSQYKEVTKVLPIARTAHPNAIIAGGGGFMTHLPLETMQLNQEFDVGCIGEGEETFKELLDHVDDQRWSKVKGVVYREDEEVLLGEPRSQIQDLDTIPYPKYDLLALDEAYFPNSPIMLSPESMMSRRRMSFVWERGCPRQCRFCSHQGMSRWDDLIIYGKDRVKEMDKEQRVLPARWPTPRYCVENVKYVRFKYGIDFATILDENMLSNRTWTEEFCNLYMDEGLHELVPWGSLGDAPSVAAHPEMVRTLREAGCKYISFGFESASDKVLLKDIGKGQTQKMEQAAVNAMIKYGLGPVATFMLGNPTEDINDLLETVHFWVRNKIEVDPFICTPYPGSPYFETYREQILMQYDERLVYWKKHPEVADEETVKKWKWEALNRFLKELDDAYDLTAHVSQVFDYGDLLALKSLMKSKDMGRILKLAHIRGWPHQEKWEPWCPTCKATKALALPKEEEIRSVGPMVVRGNPNVRV